MADRASSGATVQLVRPPDSTDRRTTRLGVGLLVSLVVGWPALSGALTGGDAFEASIARFVAIVAVSVGGVLCLGWLYDHFTGVTAGPSPDAGIPPAQDTEEEQR